ncbi:MAG TPA: O-antigen ligase domain-containing protein [Leptolyngbyaceae cyanobacterium]
MTQVAPSTYPAVAKQTETPGEKQGKALMVVWAVLVALCLLVRAGKLLILIFPAGSVAVGLFLYFRAPVLYVSFTWWMLFLGALVRKIIDYQSGYVTPGRWGTPALVVAAISLITLFKYLPRIHKQGGMPFLLSLMALTYAFLNGLVYGRLSAQYIVGAFEWFGPLAFGFHLFAQWRDYPKYRKSIFSTFIGGTLVMGSYGIYQYWVVPEWDRFYLSQLGVTSFGAGLPFDVRIWGTSTSPQEFAAILLAGIILIFSGQGIIRFAAAGTGYLGFLLTMARSGWLGWCVSIVMFMPSLKLQLQMRLLTTILVMALVVVPLARMEPFAGVIGERLQSFTEGKDDRSFEDRQEGYQELSKAATTQFMGLGLGGSPNINTSIGGTDSSIFPLLFQLGWFGSLAYVGGIALMLIKAFQIQQLRSDAFGSAARAIALGVFAQFSLNQVFTNVFGFVLWGFLGISLAAGNYHQSSGSKKQSASS